MFEPPAFLRLAPLQIDRPGGPGELTLIDALSRARKVFDGYTAGMALDRGRLRQALRRPGPTPALDRERYLFLGWLAWLEGNPAGAEAVLAAAEARGREAAEEEAGGELAALEPAQLQARVTYWLARVRLLAGKGNAISEYEGALRRLSGWPQATAWYVDLLWRAGRVDRAEQVWKSVRGNKRVAASEEAALLDARGHLRRGELAPAERLLREAAVQSGVVWVERQLLLAWALAGMRHWDGAREAVALAGQGPYPAAALAAWGAMLEAREKGGPGPGEAGPIWRPLLLGQAERAAGRSAEAAAAYREAAAVALVQPFARYGLVSLGQDDPAALLASAPGLFLAVRCRARVAMARFARREVGPGELLEAVQQAANAGYRTPAGDHYRRLARALQLRSPTPDDLAELVEVEAGPVERDNALRVAVELAGRLAPADAAGWLARWAGDEAVLADPGLGAAHARASRRAALMQGDGAAMPSGEGHPAGALARLADRMAEGQALDDAGVARLREVASAAGYRGVARALLLYEAARRGDLAGVAEQLDAADGWRELRSGPPRFVLQALAALAAGHPTFVAWRQSLGGWLRQWPAGQLGAEGSMLAAAAGLAAPAEDAAVPAGVEPSAWLLHQASRALLRGAPGEALALVRRAADAGPLPAAAERAVPALERLADAAGLAARPGAPAGGALGGLVEELRRLPGAGGDDLAGRLAEAEGREDLTPRLHHHLALLATREAEHQERREPAEAAGTWRRAWGHWLALAASEEGPAAEARGGLFDHLLAGHRRRLNELLRQGEVEPARRYADLVRQLPDMAGPERPSLREELAARAERFRDDLATEHLLSTREAMRYGEVPEGWRADYERGLTALRRLMALDRDNVRLLTAVVETCVEWFLDLYNAGDAGRLRQEVERYGPLAAHLMRLTASQSGEHPSRPALSEFYKFRGFVEPDPASRAGLYREALRLSPANENVRELLEQMGAEGPLSGGDDE